MQKNILWNANYESKNNDYRNVHTILNGVIFRQISYDIVL